MAIAFRIRRRLGIALAAFAAMLPGVADASTGKRCETMPAGCTACACCVESGPAAVPVAAASTPDRAIVVQTAPCSCHSDEPTAPARLPDRGDDGRRVDAGRALAADEPPTLRGPRPPAAIAFMPDVGPPRSPIYLRTSRLLI